MIESLHFHRGYSLKASQIKAPYKLWHYQYYSVAVFTFAKLSFDYQFVDHPAYNRNRGPVSILGFRAHAEL